MPNVQINLVVIQAADIEASAQFYRLLGLDFVKHSHGKGPEHYASENGPVVFEIYPRQNETGSHFGLRLGFQVHSVDESVAALQKAGAVIVPPAKHSPWGRRAVVDDPDGCRLELIQPLSSGADSI